MKPGAEILIVEDDPVFGEMLLMHLEDQGHLPSLVTSLAQAGEVLSMSQPDLVLLDHQLPDGFGLDLLKALHEHDNAPPVIMITGVSDNALVIEAMGHGAFDFIRKPLEDVELDTTVTNALRTERLTRQVSAVTEMEPYRADVNQIVGSSPEILAICKTIGAVAQREAPVLITGETGTGKEVVARALHHHSERPGLFLPTNCSALSEHLLESELFGHEKGSFTGAHARKQGRFELTHEGTLFLDELGEMPLALQAKLLRVLQEGRFERVGGTQTLDTDARIIAATNRDLPAMIEQGLFREDLFYRLNVVHVELPPLRERLDDLPALTEHLLKKINQRQHTRVERITESAWKRLKGYTWPGNIRELENVLTRAVVMTRNDTLTADVLGLTTAGSVDSQPAAVPPTIREVSLETVEKEHVAAILEHVKWHKGNACRILGISRPALERKIGKFGLL